MWQMCCFRRGVPSSVLEDLSSFLQFGQVHATRRILVLAEPFSLGVDVWTSGWLTAVARAGTEICTTCHLFGSLASCCKACVCPDGRPAPPGFTAGTKFGGAAIICACNALFSTLIGFRSVEVSIGSVLSQVGSCFGWRGRFAKAGADCRMVCCGRGCRLLVLSSGWVLAVRGLLDWSDGIVATVWREGTVEVDWVVLVGLDWENETCETACAIPPMLPTIETPEAAKAASGPPPPAPTTWICWSWAPAGVMMLASCGLMLVWGCWPAAPSCE